MVEPYMVSRSTRLQWGRMERIIYLLQLIGCRAYTKGWNPVLSKRWRKLDKREASGL